MILNSIEDVAERRLHSAGRNYLDRSLQLANMRSQERHYSTAIVVASGALQWLATRSRYAQRWGLESSLALLANEFGSRTAVAFGDAGSQLLSKAESEYQTAEAKPHSAIRERDAIEGEVKALIGYGEKLLSLAPAGSRWLEPPGKDALDKAVTEAHSLLSGFRDPDQPSTR